MSGKKALPPNIEPAQVAKWFSALNRRDLTALENLSKNKQILDVQDDNGNTALRIAAYTGYLEGVRFLLAAGANINASGNLGNTPLMAAAEKNHVETCQVLVDAALKTSADINLKNHEGNTPLTLAAFMGNTKILQILVQAKAKVNLQNNEGLAALQMAANEGRQEAVEFLLNEAQPDLELTNKVGFSALTMAASQGHTSIVRALLLKGAKRLQRNKDGATPLMLAAFNGYFETVQALIEDNPELEQDLSLTDERGETALMYAVWKGHTRIVRILGLKSSKQVINQRNKNGLTALTMAAQCNHVETLRVLVEELGLAVDGIEVDSNESSAVAGKTDRNDTPLMHAAARGHLESVQVFLDNGADVKRQNETGLTALLLATDTNRPQVVRALLSKDRSGVDLTNRTGCSALSAAVSRGYSEITQILIDNGADVNKFYESAGTPLIRAAANNRPNIIRILAKSADINFKTPKMGLTALMFAGHKGQVEALEALMEQEAIDLSVKNEAGEDCYHFVLNHAPKENTHNIILSKLFFGRLRHTPSSKYLAETVEELKKLFKKLDKEKALEFSKDYMFKIRLGALVEIRGSDCHEIQKLKEYRATYADKWLSIPFRNLVENLKKFKEKRLPLVLAQSSLEWNEIAHHLKSQSLEEEFHAIKIRLHQIDHIIKEGERQEKEISENLAELERADTEQGSRFLAKASPYYGRVLDNLKRAREFQKVLNESIIHLTEPSNKMSQYLQYATLHKAQNVVSRLRGLENEILSAKQDISACHAKIQEYRKGSQEFKDKQKAREAAALRAQRKMKDIEAKLAREKEETDKREQEEMANAAVERENYLRRQAESQEKLKVIRARKKKKDQERKEQCESELRTKKASSYRATGGSVSKRLEKPTTSTRLDRLKPYTLEHASGLASHLEGITAIQKIKSAFSDAKIAEENLEIRLIERDALLGAIAGMLEEIKTNESAPLSFGIAQTLRNLLYHYPQHLVGEELKDLVALRQLAFLLHDWLGTEIRKGTRAITVENFLEMIAPLGKDKAYEEGFILLNRWLKSDLILRFRYPSLDNIISQIEYHQNAILCCDQQNLKVNKEVALIAKNYNRACLGAKAAELRDKHRGVAKKFAWLLQGYIDKGKEIRHPRKVVCLPDLNDLSGGDRKRERETENTERDRLDHFSEGAGGTPRSNSFTEDSEVETRETKEKTERREQPPLPVPSNRGSAPLSKPLGNAATKGTPPITNQSVSASKVEMASSPPAIYAIELLSSSTSISMGTTYTYRMSDGSKQTYSTEQEIRVSQNASRQTPLSTASGEKPQGPHASPTLIFSNIRPPSPPLLTAETSPVSQKEKQSMLKPGKALAKDE